MREVRKVPKVRSTCAAKMFGGEAEPNRDVARECGLKPLSAAVQMQRFQLLGHILRRDQTDATRAATYDRMAQPRR